MRALRPLPMLGRAAAMPEERALRMASAARESAGAARTSLAELPDGRLVDRFGRSITYLRLSVTDRCNLRCEYCVPLTRQEFLPREALLDDDEIVAILRVMADAGLEKVRFTGGEPLVRPGIVELIRRVRDIAGIRKLCVSTNGLLLEDMAERLMEAGVDHFNVSVDTLDPERYRAVTRGGDLAQVLRGLDRLLALGTRTLKINAVLMRGVNDDQIDRFLAIPRERPIEVRFIELMPLSHCGEIHDDRYVPAAHVVEALERLGASPEDRSGPTDGPAARWRLPGALAPVGLISPVSETHFCDRCNRVRMSADGQLKLCLFGDAYVDLRAAIRGGGGVAAVEDRLVEAMNLKPEKMSGFSGFTMMGIGG